MQKTVTGVIAMVMLVVFLGNYLIKIGSWPLGIIIVGVLAMAIFDYVQTFREQSGPGP